MNNANVLDRNDEGKITDRNGDSVVEVSESQVSKRDELLGRIAASEGQIEEKKAATLRALDWQSKMAGDRGVGNLDKNGEPRDPTVGRLSSQINDEYGKIHETRDEIKNEDEVSGKYADANLPELRQAATELANKDLEKRGKVLIDPAVEHSDIPENQYISPPAEEVNVAAETQPQSAGALSGPKQPQQ